MPNLAKVASSLGKRAPTAWREATRIEGWLRNLRKVNGRALNKLRSPVVRAPDCGPAQAGVQLERGNQLERRTVVRRKQGEQGGAG